MTNVSLTLPFAGVSNARTYQALTTRDGQPLKGELLIRSGRLAHATPADVAALKALNVSAVVDLRLPSEAAANPDVSLPQVAASATPLASDAVTAKYQTLPALFTFLSGHQGAVDWMIAGYQNMLLDPEQRASLAQMVRAVSSAPGAVLLHCSAGKDRTGVACALLLDALGVDRTFIYQDYLLTNIAAAEHAAALRQALSTAGGTPAMQAELAALGRADQRYLAAVFTLLDTRFAGSRGFIRETLGLRESGLHQLLTKFAG
ncbi:tyrosine-protein phosphatase [Lacticaseibacillus suibinensis]|uniref:tyrosine-protein phosphatase n=1 Tax=Lacticaseibacillus suibinensis TaxID=2486011 RepID=UPI0013DE2399|nr:tyrosine-protein phosphatase [Lacticaseibacillus suibinensis]